MPRLLKAALFVPILFAVIVTIALTIFFSEEFVDRGEEGKNMLYLIVASCLILVQVLIFVFGTPYYFWLKKHNNVTSRNILLGGFGFGALTGLAMVILSRNDTMVIQLGQMLFYGVCGLAVAHLLWWLGLKPRESKPKE